MNISEYLELFQIFLLPTPIHVQGCKLIAKVDSKSTTEVTKRTKTCDSILTISNFAARSQKIVQRQMDFPTYVHTASLGALSLSKTH